MHKRCILNGKVKDITKNQIDAYLLVNFITMTVTTDQIVSLRSFIVRRIVLLKFITRMINTNNQLMM